MSDTKTCPFCAEDIKAAAIKCKHCGEMLMQSEPESTPLETTKEPDLESVETLVKTTKPSEPEKAKPEPPNQLAMAGCFGILAVFFVWIIVSSPTQPSYPDGRSEGIEVGHAMRDTQKYENGQINEIVDGVVSQRQSEIYSKGEKFGDGWVSGVKEGMYR